MAVNSLPPNPLPEPDRTAAEGLRFRLPLLWWRIAFGVYALALTTATHWPRLELPPQSPASDKTVHVIAFAGAMFLLWQTRWIRRWWMVVLLAIVWAGVDEWTQALPGVHRHASLDDFAANLAGIALALVFIGAMDLYRRCRGS